MISLLLSFFIAIAAAAGGSVYIYKNFKPFYKYSLPSLEVIQAERDMWTAYLKALPEFIFIFIFNVPK